MTTAFRSVYTQPGLYDQLLLPHIYDGRSDDELIAEAMDAFYGPAPAIPSLAIVEFGCGTGRVTGHLAPYASSLIGADYSPAMTEAFADRFPHARTVTADTPTAVQRLHADGLTGEVDVIGAFWSLSYPLSDYLEKLDEHGSTATRDMDVATGQALAFVHAMTGLLAPSGRLLALFFDADSPEQQLVTRLWNRLGPCPGGRNYTRTLLLRGLQEKAERDGGVLTVTHHTGVATAPDQASAMAWFLAVHCKNHPVIVSNPATIPAIGEFIAEHTEPDGRVTIPSGAYLISYHAGESNAAS
jgi:SAM-dependent methyltransferase